MIPRHRLLLALLLASHFTGCRTSSPNPGERAAPLSVAPTTIAHSARTIVGSAAEKVPSPPPKGTKPSLFNRATDALSISTPAGRAARQQRKLIAAGVPRSVKVKDGALAWGTYAKATSAGKKATLATDSATLQVATNAVAGRGNTAQQTAATQQAKDWRAVLAGPVGSVLALALAAGIVLFLLRRKAAKSLL